MIYSISNELYTAINLYCYTPRMEILQGSINTAFKEVLPELTVYRWFFIF